MVNISSLVSDIYGLLQGKSISDPAVLEKFGPELGKILTARLLSAGEERVPSLRMSNIGKPLRQLWYDQNGYKPEELSGQTLLKFLYGDLIEALVIVLAEAAGHTVERLQEEISVDGILGHIDCVLDGVLVDVKSTSPYGFNKFKDGSLFEDGNDPFGYVGQLAGYSEALELPAAWVTINKVSGEITVLHLPQKNVKDYDIRSRIETARKAVGSKDVPERCYKDEPDGQSGNRKLALGCSCCGHRFDCWGDSNDGQGLRSFAYSTGVRYLTNVSKTPNVFEIQNKKKVINN